MASIFYTVGGMGKKPDEKYKHASPKKFTKSDRRMKPILGNQTRINDDLFDNTLRTIN